MSELGAKNRN